MIWAGSVCCNISVWQPSFGGKFKSLARLYCLDVRSFASAPVPSTSQPKKCTQTQRGLFSVQGISDLASLLHRGVACFNPRWSHCKLGPNCQWDVDSANWLYNSMSRMRFSHALRKIGQAQVMTPSAMVTVTQGQPSQNMFNMLLIFQFINTY